MHAFSPTSFKTHRSTVRGKVELAYNREGIGGVPLLMIHGWPGGKRLFWRNIEALAQAGFEVIVPDQRGFGESPVVRGESLTVQEAAHDLHALMTLLGHKSCIVVAGDQGSGVGIQLSQLFPGFVKRFVTFNGFAPALPALYTSHGVPGSQFEEIMKVSDHLALHGLQADQLAASLPDDAARLAYVKSFYRGHVWKEGEPVRNLAGPNGFTDAEASFHAEQISSAESFRASLNIYEGFMNPRPDAEPFLIDRPIEVETLVLWGTFDEIVGIEYPRQMTLACNKLVGPYFVEAGHFVQWEAATILNNTIAAFNRDLIRSH